LPDQLNQTWLPLLNHLSASVDDFAESLQEGLITCITQLDSQLERSFLDTLASWLLFLFGSDRPVLATPKLPGRIQMADADLAEEERERPTILLARRCLTFPTSTSLAVARQLCAKDEQLLDRVKGLLEMAESKASSGKDSEQRQEEQLISKEGVEAAAAASQVEQSVLEMELRLKGLRERETIPSPLLSSMVSLPSTATTEYYKARQEDICRRLPGWHMAPDDWKPTPLGCLNGSVPDLILLN
jgi:hypothetical protein